MTYQTNNPVGSVDVRDLYDNAEAFDNFSAGPLDAYPDRFGVSRQSLQGIRNASQYQVLGAYAAGLQFTAMNQVFSYLGEFYAPGPSIVLPYTTTGVGAAEIATFRNVGDAVLRGDLANDADPLKGPALVAFRSGATLADVAGSNGAVQLFSQRSLASSVSLAALAQVRINAIEFGMTGDGSDVTVKMQALRDYVATLGTSVQVEFQAGDYVCSAWPNWNMQGLTLVPLGTVYWTNTGAGDCVRIDAGASPGKISNINFGVGGGQIIARGGPATGNAFFVRGLVRGQVKGRVYGAGSTDKCGLLALGCVLVNFDINVTPDESGGWYLGGKPNFGYVLNHGGNAAAQTSYCTFITPSIQGCIEGMWLLGTLGNVFIGGDSEYNNANGVYLSPEALNNKFFGTDFEVNGARDIDCGGKYNEFHGCDTNVIALINATGVSNQIIGGNHDAIQIVSGATRTLISGVKYNRSLGAATITDAGTATRFRDITNLANGAFGDAIKTSVALTVGASPWTYTNNSGNPIRFHAVGGTVGSMTLYQGASSAVLPIPGATDAALTTVLPGEQVQIVYTVAPTVKIFIG